LDCAPYDRWQNTDGIDHNDWFSYGMGDCVASFKKIVSVAKATIIDHSPRICRSFAIITTKPNELYAELHDRLPVVLKPETWSEGSARSLQTPASLRPYSRPTHQKE
jgi:putative SOS response-associated peptidase YedK